MYNVSYNDDLAHLLVNKDIQIEQDLWKQNKSVKRLAVLIC